MGGGERWNHCQSHNTSKGRLEVSLQTRSKGLNNGISTFDITALPSTWSNLSNVSSTFQKAKDSKDSARVVLNQDAKSWYDMSKISRVLEEEQALPSVIVRDIDRIRFDNRNSWDRHGGGAREWYSWCDGAKVDCGSFEGE